MILAKHSRDQTRPKVDQGSIRFRQIGIGIEHEKQVNVRVIPTGTAIQQSVDLAYELYNYVFRRVPRDLRSKLGESDGQGTHLKDVLDRRSAWALRDALSH